MRVMKFHRRERIASLLQAQLNKLLLKEVEFNEAVVTIVDIKVSAKIEEAIIKIAVYPSHKGPDALQILHDCRGKLQFLLLRKMNIKPMPKLVFKLEIDKEKEVVVPD